jgi:GT2 family glycosyltransferase
MPLIAYVCVNYQSPSDTLTHLQQLHRTSTQPYAAVVVENSPRRYEDIEAWVSRHAVNHRYLSADGNVGYLNGLGLGVRCALDAWPDVKWVVLSNVDLTLDAPQFERRLGQLCHDPGVGIVGPRIVSSMSTRDQNPFLAERPSLARMRMWRATYRNHWIGAFYQLGADLWRHHLQRVATGAPRRQPTHRECDAARDVYAVHGSIFCLSGPFAHSAGELRWPCFLFGEELWFAERARQLGLRVVYDPCIVVEHREHVTTATLSSRAKMRWHHQSIDWLIEHHWTAA